MDNLLNAFRRYLEKHTVDDNERIGRHVDTAKEFITYLEESQIRRWAMFRYLRSRDHANEFIKKEYEASAKKTRDSRTKELEHFQKFIRRNGQLDFLAAWIRGLGTRGVVYLVGIIVTLILTITGLAAAFFNWSPYQSIAKLFPTDTPTATLTPTITITASSTPTNTPTITPTPNATQLAWSTLLPTPDPAFLPEIRQMDDGAEQVWVPAGYFVAGDQVGIGFDDETPHAVFTDGFWIDRFLVTNAQYASCPDEVCEPPAETISHKRPNGYFGIPAFNGFPVIEVTWSQAQSYCEWRGGRLPTEAEWEKTAGWNPRTGKTFIYPWGDQEPHKGLANYDNVDLDTTAVDTYLEGVSPVGAYDMAGNVWQWVFDRYAPYSGDELINPRGPELGEDRVVRGGSWSNDTEAQFLRVANRGVNNPSHPNNETGFRCAFDN